ncbi:MAG: hypothetical protein RBT80_09460 [Candidatus Vecturithrix sp.]|jgi:hypothetical protein|nr:hypothetical protein [Candidatus Vecturithrix sp.]
MNERIVLNTDPLIDLQEAIIGMRNGGYRFHDRIIEFALREASEG